MNKLENGQPIQKYPVHVQNAPLHVDEEMMLQAIEYALVMGKHLQLLKDQKKVLRQENIALKERVEKLPSTLQLELRSVHEDAMAKLQTISFKINELIQTYKRFQNETGAIRRPNPFDFSFFMNCGAVYATERVLVYLEDCKAFPDVLLDNNGYEKCSKKAFKKLLKSESVARELNETAVTELNAAPENKAVEPVIPARFQQIAEQMNRREKKVAQIQADNTILHKQIETLKTGAQSNGKAYRLLVEIYSLEPCLNHLELLQKRISECIQRLIDTTPTLTKLRDKNEFRGYIARCQVMQSDVAALISQIEEVAKAIKGKI